MTDRANWELWKVPYKLDAKHFNGMQKTEDDERRINVVSIFAENCRETKRATLGKAKLETGEEYEVVDRMYWDEFLLDPMTVALCAQAVGMPTSHLLRFLCSKCMPLKGEIFFWMEAWFRDAFEKSEERRSEIALALEKIHADFRLKEAEAATQKAKAAAEARHSKPGGTRAKQSAIRAVWASGIYGDRDLCAAQEYEALEFGSLGTARRALQNTPNPDPWPGKKGGKRFRSA